MIIDIQIEGDTIYDVDNKDTLSVMEAWYMEYGN